MSETKLRSFDAWKTSLRNFDWLHDSISGGMDVDLLVERNGHFLVVEGKPYDNGVRIPYGQHRALYRLSRQPKTRVYLVGEGKGDQLHVINYNDQSKAPVFVRTGAVSWWEPERFIPTTKEQFTLLVKAWWDDVSDS